jgi:hypothetical protein
MCEDTQLFICFEEQDNKKEFLNQIISLLCFAKDAVLSRK